MARHRDRGLYRRGTSPPAPCVTLDLPASDPMGTLPWLILAWYEVTGVEGGGGEGTPGCLGKGGHMNGAVV